MLIGIENEIENESGVESEVSPEPQNDAQSTEGQEAKSVSPEPKEVPFHEHPRWKEVMEERNAERQANAALQRQLAEMQRAFQESQKPRDNKPDFKEVSSKMGERLKGIDPEYAQYMQMLEQQALSAKEELTQFREEQFVNRAVSRFDELNKSNSVSPEIAGLYKAQLDQAYREGKIRNMEDLESAYKSIHEPFSKMLEAREKAYLEKYTADKKSTASRPSPQSKGKAAPQTTGSKTYANDQQRRAAMVKDVVADLRAQKDLG